MVSQVALNPMQVTTAAGMFSTTTYGMIQGVVMDDPAARNWLAGGYLASTETLPMWGGVGITEGIPGVTPGPDVALGGPISRATSLANLTGFSVFNQAHHMLNLPGQAVPLALSGMSVHFFRFGSNIRIPVKCDPALANIDGNPVNQQVSWDFAGQRLVPYNAAYGNLAITAATYNNSTGVATYTTSSAHGLPVGADFSVAGVTPAAYNGSFTAIAGTTGPTLTANLGAGLGLGAATAFGNLVGGGGPLNVRVLNVQQTNCMTVNFNPATGIVSGWSYNDACALILV